MLPKQRKSESNPKRQAPEAGKIIDYGYLWQREDAAGQVNASKDRPCLIWEVRKIEELFIVSVLPISTSSMGARVPIHPRERAALGLPEDCNVVIEEMNIFNWPGPDIVPQDDRTMMRPNPASRKLTDTIAEAIEGRRVAKVFRPD